MGEIKTEHYLIDKVVFDDKEIVDSSSGHMRIVVLFFHCLLLLNTFLLDGIGRPGLLRRDVLGGRSAKRLHGAPLLRLGNEAKVLATKARKVIQIG